VWTHIDKHNNHGTNIGRSWRPILTLQHTESFTNTPTDMEMVRTPLDGATRHTTPHIMANPRIGDCCDAHPPHSEQIWPPRFSNLACHCWWEVSLLVQYSRRSVSSLSMADMVQGTFLTNSIICYAYKIISSGVINIMEVLSITTSRVLFPMVYSDLAINALTKVIIMQLASMVHWCTRIKR